MFFPKFKLMGGRVIKTGIAVFVTVLVCQFFHLPVIFAVITAIVTIEPTASDSIRKGFIRFPASAIGAAYSMTFAAIFGDQAITYSLSAILTIITCYKFKLEAGILVATLTAVNMIPTTYDHFFISFIERLATTTIGLTFSTLVNILILPPHYSRIITKNTTALYEKSGSLLRQRVEDILTSKSNKETGLIFNGLMKEIEKTEQLCHYQREEWKYHRHTKQEIREFHYEYKKLNVLRQILYHIGNLLYVPFVSTNWDYDVKEKMLGIVASLAHILESNDHQIPERHYELIKELGEQFWHIKNELSNETHTHSQHISSKGIVYYELLAINDLAEELHHIHQSENKKDKVSFS